MTGIHAAVGIAAVALFAAAGILGAWRFWRVEPSETFWRLLRAAQAVLMVEIVLGGILLLAHRKSHDQLHYLYGLLPLGVSLIGEQLRLAAADTVLAARGLSSAEEVGELPADRQRSVVMAIVRREMGVMTVAALVIVGLT